MANKISYNLSMAHLWQREGRNGGYYAVWQEGKKRRKRALCMPGEKRATKDPKLAKKLLNKFNRDLMAGKVIPIVSGVKVTLFPFCKEFLEHIKTDKEDSTCYLYKIALEKAKKSWGDIPLNHISVRHLDQLLSDMKKDELKPPTINKNYRHIKAAIRKAVEWDYINKAPIFPPQLKVKKQVRYIPKDHLQKIFSKIEDDEFFDLCLLSGYTGLRSGEILRLTKNDIDNPIGFLRITSEQKNKEESRVPINSTTRGLLVKAVERKNKRKLFRFRDQSDVSHRFKDSVRDAGFETYRFHDMRHTFASYLAMENENLIAIQELMRHKSFASTLVYSKLSPEHLQSASEKVNLGPMLRPVKKAK